jgi:hypothetical protein
MAEPKSDFGAGFWSRSLDEVDKEVARLSTICNIRILDPGVIERVLANDSTVCGASNQIAFDKLRNVLMMHYNVRSKAADAIGNLKTDVVLKEIVERLKKQFGDRLGGPPPKA